MEGTSRRTFLRRTVATSLAIPLSASFGPFAVIASRPKSRVAQVVRPGLLGGKGFAAAARIPASSLVPLVEEAVRAATGISDIQTAWMTLVRPKDVIGIKVNALAGPGLSTRPALADAIAQSLQKAGVPAGNIILWDRSSAELKRAGYPLSTAKDRVRCFGSDSLPLPYERTPEAAGSIGSCFATLVSRYCTALINIPILKDHDLSGVSLGMKNFYGAIHNPNKYHDNCCDPFIADLSTHPHLRGKLRLVVVDGLAGQYHGGPSLKPQWGFPFEGLLAGADPVAVDRIGALIIEEQRKAHKMKSLAEDGRPPRFIATAARLGLGTDQPDEIEWKKI